jgi:ribonucleoside-triphosphate reductase
MQWFNAERLKCVLTFPVESFAMVYQNGQFLDPENAKFVAEEYARGHSFFTYISDTVDSLSSCCRLKNKLQTKEFNFTNGNMGLQTGSKSVITINLNRIIQDWARTIEFDSLFNEKNLASFKEYLGTILERIYKYHIAYNELLWDMKDAHLLPVYDAGFIDLNKQYLTIGINGLNQAAEFVGCTCNDNEQYKQFCQLIFSSIADLNKAHNGKFNGHTLTFNTEQVPAESLAVKNYNWDKEDDYWVPKDTNLYASYIFKPNDPTVDIYEKLRMHGREYIGDYLDGGAAAHLNLEEHLTADQYMNVINYAAQVGCNYFTFNIPMTECEECGHIVNAPVHTCPKCGSEKVKYWTRIIGYLTATKSWSSGRREEFKSRVFHGQGNEYVTGANL